MGAESCTMIHLWEGVNDIRNYKLVQICVGNLFRLIHDLSVKISGHLSVLAQILAI